MTRWLVLLCFAASTPAIAQAWPSVSGGLARAGGGENDVAVVVGITDYLLLPDVPGAAENATDWMEHLVRVRGVPLDRVTLLKDTEATKESIETALKRAVAASRPGGLLWLVFVGHGSPAPDGHDGLVLGTDTQGNDVSLAARGIKQGAALELLRAGKQAQSIVVFDACFSGKTNDGAAPLVTGLQATPPVRRAVAEPKATIFSSSDTFAGPLPGASRPAFSYLLLGALRGWGDRNDDKSVSADEAFSFARDTMKVALKSEARTPRLSGRGDLALGGAREVAPDVTAILTGRCPPTKRWDGLRCSDTPCPPGASWNGSSCTSASVTCPPGAQWNGSSCVGMGVDVAVISKDAAMAPATGPLAFSRFALKNGLEVIVHEDHSVPLVAVVVGVHVGGSDAPGGFAHFFEHLLFEGTKHIAGDGAIEKELTAAGATLINATTSDAETTFFEVMPSSRLETALWIESDRLAFSAFTQSQLDAQREVVRNERRQRWDSSPAGASETALAAALYPTSAPLHDGVIGSAAALDGLSLAAARDFYDKWYAPSNVTLVLAGDVDETRARYLVEKWFSDLPQRPRPARAPTPARLTKSVRIPVGPPATGAHWSWTTNGTSELEDTDLDLIAEYLGVRMKQAMAAAAIEAESSVQNRSDPRGARFEIEVVPRRAEMVADVEDIVQGEIARLFTSPPEAAELKAAARRLRLVLLRGLEPPLGRARILASGAAFGDARRPARQLASIPTRKPTDVLATARRWLDQPRVVVVAESGSGQ